MRVCTHTLIVVIGIKDPRPQNNWRCESSWSGYFWLKWGIQEYRDFSLANLDLEQQSRSHPDIWSLTTAEELRLLGLPEASSHLLWLFCWRPPHSGALFWESFDPEGSKPPSIMSHWGQEVLVVHPVFGHFLFSDLNAYSFNIDVSVCFPLQSQWKILLTNIATRSSVCPSFS